MDVTLEDVLQALGQKTAEVFVLARRVAELEQELGQLYSRIAEAELPIDERVPEPPE